MELGTKQPEIGLGRKQEQNKNKSDGTRQNNNDLNNKIDGTWKKIQNKTTTWNNNKIDGTWNKTKQNR